jgi:integrase/recombinase XerC
MAGNLLPTSPPASPSVRAAWLAEVGARTGSERTPAEYGRIVERFLLLAGDPTRATAAAVHAFAYAPGPSGRAPSNSTIAVRLAAVSSFLDFLRRMGATSGNPALDVKRPRNKDPEPRGLTADEVRALLEATPDTPAGRRDRAIILTMVLTGLRRSEALGLRKADLTRNGAVYYRARTKGGVNRLRELPAPAYVAIVDAVALDDLPDEARLFDVSSAGFAANLARYARTAGLVGVSPHVLRHTAAKLRRQSGATIEDVQQFLGHRSLATTSRYLQRLEGEDDPGWTGVASVLGLGSDAR